MPVRGVINISRETFYFVSVIKSWITSFLDQRAVPIPYIIQIQAPGHFKNLSIEVHCENPTCLSW